MGIEEYFDPYTYDSDDEDGVWCRYCGEERLHWKNDGLFSALFDADGVRHFCKPHPDDFEDIS